MKIMIRNPLGKFDSLMREARPFMQEDDARSIAFTEEPERPFACCERLLGEPSIALMIPLTMQGPGILLISRELMRSEFLAVSRGGILAGRLNYPQKRATCRTNPDLQLRYHPASRNPGAIRNDGPNPTWY